MIIGAICFLAIVLSLVARRLAALPGLYLSAFFMGMAIIAPPAWNWSRDTNGAGFPYVIPSSTDWFGLGTTVFACASIGASLGALVAVAFFRDRLDFAAIARAIAAPKVMRSAQGVSAVFLALWLLGQGPSFLLRDEYLRTDGPEFLLRAVSLLGPLAGICAFAASAFAKSRPIRIAGGMLAFAWWAVTLAVGTRLSVGFVLVALVIVVWRTVAQRTLLSIVGCIVLTPVLIYTTLVTFTLTLVVRGTPHGLLRLPGMFSDPNVPHPFDLESWLRPVKWFVSSVASAAPLTEMSARYAPDGTLLLANLNPLPAALINVDGYSDERMWPYFWVPLGFLGEWYGAFGTLGQIALMACISAIAGISCVALQRRNLNAGVLLTLVLIAAMSFLMIQYPSRSAGRIISFVVFVPVVLIGVDSMIRLWRGARRHAPPLSRAKVAPPSTSRIARLPMKEAVNSNRR